MLFHSQCMFMIFHERKYEETISAIRYFHNNNDIDKFIIQFPFDAMLVAVDSIPYCNLRQWSEGCLDSEGYILQSRSTTQSGFPKAAVFHVCMYICCFNFPYIYTLSVSCPGWVANGSGYLLSRLGPLWWLPIDCTFAADRFSCCRSCSRHCRPGSRCVSSS